MRRSFDRATLTPLREMPSEDALVLLAIHCKPDPNYQPVNEPTTRRWHARTYVGRRVRDSHNGSQVVRHTRQDRRRRCH